MGQDARGKQVRIHDRVMDKKGVIYHVAWTAKHLRKTGIVNSCPLDGIPPFVLLKSSRVFRVRRTIETGSRRRWTYLYDKYVRPMKRRTQSLRKKVEAMPLRPCPVCIHDEAPVRFKLGVPVWQGKKLRVCTTRCARRVRKEVKIAVEYGVDQDIAKRRAAYKYMKIGGQI